MKQFGLKITSLCFAVLLLLCAVTPVLAEEATKAETTQKESAQKESSGKTSQKTEKKGDSAQLTINKDAKVDVGKTVTYTLYISETVKPIVGFELCLFYDKDHLQYQKGSLKFDNFDVVVYNEDLEGRIPMNHSNLSNTKVFSDKTQFVSASFKVLDGGEADISYFVTELYSENFEAEPYLKSYKFTYDLKEGDNTLLKNATPEVNTGSFAQGNYQGDFVNYADGMGEDNSPKDSGEHVRVGSVVKSSVIEVTRVVPGEEGASGTGGGFFNSIWFFLIAGVLVAGAIVTAVVLVSKNSKKPEE